LAVIVALAASFLFVLDAAMRTGEGRWGGRTASDWRPSLTSSSAAARDSALAGLRMLAPHSSRTIRSAATMLSDHDENVTTSAVQALLDAARNGGPAVVTVQQEVYRMLVVGDSRARANAARVAGALGALGAPVVPALIIAGADTAELARAAVATALGGTLEVAPLFLAPPVLRTAIAQLLSAARDPAWLVRDAALEALFRAAPTDARLAAIVDAALEDSCAEVRERAASIKSAMKGRGYDITQPE
jgi:HEAT repeat protein